MSAFTDLVKQEMDRRGWNESDLAREAELSRQAINFLLNGRTKSPSVETIKGIARAFKLPVDEFARAAGLMPPLSFREKLIRRIEEKLSKISDPRDIDRIERMIDLLADNDDDPPKRSK